MEEQTDVTEEIRGVPPRDILLNNMASIDKDTAARIEFKRRQQRANAVFRAKQALMVVSLILSIGLLAYVVTEINLLKFYDKDEAVATETVQEISPVYGCFATVGTSSLELALPGKPGHVIGVGFHQAEKRTAVAITPATECYNRETTVTVRRAVLAAEQPVLFIMESRGRGSAPTSAIDVAMIPYSEVLSPVDGTVAVVKTYSLYSKVTDYHIEIQPDGYPDLRLAIIHVDDVGLTVGQRVKKGETVVGMLRPLPEIKSQINKYLPEYADHVHIQVNPRTIDDNLGS
jgi:hypothetical protein